MRVNVAGGLQACLLALLAVGCADTVKRDEARPSHTPTALWGEHDTMGSTVKVTIWTADDQGAAAAFEAVFREFSRLDQLLSVWKEGSDVLHINIAAGDRPVAVSAETIEVLTTARRVSEWTEGKFDVTFGALSGLWKF